MSAKEVKTGKGFPSTHWTRVYLASQHEKDDGSKTLAVLLKSYRPALRQYLRYRYRVSPETIEDWISGFIEHKILERHLLKAADRRKGRFRSFLLTSLYRFVEDQRRSENRARRRPAGGLIPLEEKHEISVAHTSNSNPNPGDLRWATTVIDRARKRTEAYYRAKKRTATWEVFAAGCYRPLRHGDARPLDAELAQQHGFKSARQVSNAITTAKRRFGSFLREVVCEYEQSELAADQEIRDLMAIVSGNE